jgi:hypothetical protein
VREYLLGEIIENVGMKAFPQGIIRNRPGKRRNLQRFQDMLSSGTKKYPARGIFRGWLKARRKIKNTVQSAAEAFFNMVIFSCSPAAAPA